MKIFRWIVIIVAGMAVIGELLDFGMHSPQANGGILIFWLAIGLVTLRFELEAERKI
jgi:hypothetical protein